MEDTELSYLAGMVDADGSVILRLDKTRYRLRLYVYNTYQPLMDWLEENFGGRAVALPQRIDHHKVEYQWYLDSGPAVDLMKRIVPHMIVKRERAELAIEAWESRAPTARALRHLPVDPATMELRREYVRRFKELNKTGRRNPVTTTNEEGLINAAYE